VGVENECQEKRKAGRLKKVVRNLWPKRKTENRRRRTKIFGKRRLGDKLRSGPRDIEELVALASPQVKEWKHEPRRELEKSKDVKSQPTVRQTLRRM